MHLSSVLRIPFCYSSYVRIMGANLYGKLSLVELIFENSLYLYVKLKEY